MAKVKRGSFTVVRDVAARESQVASVREESIPASVPHRDFGGDDCWIAVLDAIVLDRLEAFFRRDSDLAQKRLSRASSSR